MSESRQVNKLRALVVFHRHSRIPYLHLFQLGRPRTFSLLIRSVPRTESEPQLQPIELGEPWYVGNNILGFV